MKEKINMSEYMKNYRDSSRVYCDCGGCYTKDGAERHFMTKKHKKFEETMNRCPNASNMKELRERQSALRKIIRKRMEEMEDIEEKIEKLYIKNE